MAYYVLAVRDDGEWFVEFGDYDRETVEFERDHLTGNHRYGNGGYKRQDTAIIHLRDDSNEATMAAIAALNAKGK